MLARRLMVAENRFAGLRVWPNGQSGHVVSGDESWRGRFHAEIGSPALLGAGVHTRTRGDARPRRCLALTLPGADRMELAEVEKQDAVRSRRV